NVPPVISNISVDPPVLWAPNHKMVDVTVSYDAADGCSRTNSVTTSLSVTSNEPAGSNEQGDVDGDWEVVDSHTVRLRAERLGAGTGRIYTIAITATDGDGNTSTATTTVTVPRDQRP
ncbi:MAG TPA: nuclease, partial [Thermoanaerobaculia bacterium]|nr:nuclease [Thermoanaerobaculia bacterium]